MANLRVKQVVSYAVLPGVVPRIRAVFTSGFGYVAFLMAQVYGMVRLLPAGHPYLDIRNKGRFGVRHVIAEAANNLIFSRKYLDQWVIFLVILMGIVIVAVQIGLIIYAYFVQPFLLQPALAQSIFNTPQPANDIAFLLLDRVFGVPDLFCNTGGVCTSVEASLPWPFHEALHDMFRFYSVGMLLIGVLIFLYFVVVVIGETAISGTPFGQRFQDVWVPLRLVMALGLLVPINYGLNSGQYIALYAAKYGSGFATNGWILFNNTIKAQSSVFPGGRGANPTGERTTLVALPKMPDITPVVQFMTTAHACAAAHWAYDTEIIPGGGPPRPTVPHSGAKIQAYFVKTPFPWMNNLEPYKVMPDVGPGGGNASYVQGLDFYDNGDILIVFGEYNQEYDEYRGNVKPVCGSIRVKITNLRHRGEGNTYGGADMMQNYYYNMINQMWYGGGAGTSNPVQELAERFVAVSAPDKLDPCSIGANNPTLPSTSPSPSGGPPSCAGQKPGAEARQALIASYSAQLKAAITQAWELYSENGLDQQINDTLINRGWGGAGIWYNTIADLNGAFVTAISEVPSQEAYPLVMELVREEVLKNNANVTPLEQFTPSTSGGKATEIADGSIGLMVAKQLNDFYKFWNADDPNQADVSKSVTRNIFIDGMNLLFGTEGLFAMRGENQHIHPLAQLTALGKGLVDATIRNFMISSGAALGAGILGGTIGPILQITSDFLMSTVFLGLTAGVVLYYVLPLLPFLYFFFALVSWTKTIFEAMVGVPLWALAHLRLDGEGLPGEAASNGYYLILEIFLRPILTVFGLIAAIAIFTAEVRLLNFIFGLAVDNLTGFAPTSLGNFPVGEKEVPRGIVDEFFFTILYAILVYMMAVASFKLIDKIPDNLMRWMGSSASSFNDINQEDTVDQIQRNTVIAGTTSAEPIIKGAKGVFGGLGGSLGGMGDDILNSFNRGTGPKGP